MIQALYYSAGMRDKTMLGRLLQRLGEQSIDIDMGLVDVNEFHISAPTARQQGIPNGDRERYRIMAENIYCRILCGLQQVRDDDIVYLCEDDVLYADQHFRMHERLDPAFWCYDLNMVYLTPGGFVDLNNRASPALSMSFGEARTIRACVLRKFGELHDRSWTAFEPYGTHGYDTRHDWAKVASIDIRENDQHTWAVGKDAKRYENETGWASASELVEQYHIKGAE